MSLRFSVIDPTTDQLHPFEVESTETIENVKALIEVDFGIPLAQQVLRFNNQNMQDKDPISKYGVKDNDVITVFRKQNRAPQQSSQLNAVLHEAQQTKQYFESNPEQLQYILHQNPELARAVLSDNINDLVTYINSRRQQQYQQRLQQMQRISQLEADPMNPDNQRLIEEEIQKQNIQQNLEIAQEHMPENFGSINMLYIEINVNKHPIQAFVDSGAQSTIMSRACAERCGIMRLVDIRYAGMAVGVGTQKIIGRIHVIDIQILDKVLQLIHPKKFIPCSLTILDGDSIDFLLGLDTLKRFQCSIDLKQNKLIFPNENIHVPFLGEGQVKKHISVEQERELYEKHEAEQKNKNQQQQPQQANQPQQQAPAPKKDTKTPVAQPGAQQRNQAQDQSVQTLVNMGFSRADALQALHAVGGNVEMAASLLTQQKYGF